MNNCDLALVPDHVWAIMTILQEARNQTFDGMLGVAEVIRNRMKAKNQRAYEIVLAPFQFSGWNTSDPNRITCAGVDLHDPRVAQAMKAWELANKNNTDSVQGAMFYHSKHLKVFPEWATKFKRVTEIGDHIFYREN